MTAWAIILVGFAIGGGAGLYAARTVKMTAMPQLVSLFNAVGGGAAALVAIDDFVRLTGEGAAPVDTTIFVVLGAVIGSVTFTGSLIAGGKLQGLIAGKPIMIPGGRIVTFALAAIAILGTAAPHPRGGRRPHPVELGHAGGPRDRRRLRAWSSGSRWSCRSAGPTCRSSSAS